VCHVIKLFVSIAGLDENYLIVEIKTISVIAIRSLDRNFTFQFKIVKFKKLLRNLTFLL
jgi:hypothetical protein